MKPRFIGLVPNPMTFIPFPPSGLPVASCEPIYMSFDEYESLRLTYIEGLNQEEVAKRMKISRGTIWRCLEGARTKVARMIVERRPLVVTSEPPQSFGESAT